MGKKRADKVFAKIEKGTSLIVVAFRTFNNREYYEIREYFQPKPDSGYESKTPLLDGKWAPTKRGVTFSPEQVDELIDALTELMKSETESVDEPKGKNAKK